MNIGQALSAIIIDWQEQPHGYPRYEIRRSSWAARWKVFISSPTHDTTETVPHLVCFMNDEVSFWVPVGGDVMAQDWQVIDSITEKEIEVAS